MKWKMLGRSLCALLVDEDDDDEADVATIVEYGQGVEHAKQAVFACRQQATAESDSQTAGSNLLAWIQFIIFHPNTPTSRCMSLFFIARRFQETYTHTLVTTIV